MFLELANVVWSVGDGCVGGWGNVPGTCATGQWTVGRGVDDNVHSSHMVWGVCGWTGSVPETCFHLHVCRCPHRAVHGGWVGGVVDSNIPGTCTHGRLAG